MLGSLAIIAGILTFAMGTSKTWMSFSVFFITMCFFQGNALPNCLSIIRKIYKKRISALDILFGLLHIK
jgi:sugar phosphate permease